MKLNENEIKYWLESTEVLSWFRSPEKVLEFDENTYSAKWFEDGKLNISYNCLDRHLESIGDKTAIIFQGEKEDNIKEITYRELHKDVCNFAKVLKANGVCKGDVVVIYMPSIPEAIIAMLAVTRIGAIHNVVFSGFSPEALMKRTMNSRSKIIITSSQAVRGGKTIPLKLLVDKSLDILEREKRLLNESILFDFRVIVYEYPDHDIFPMKPGRDIFWTSAMEKHRKYDDFPIAELNSEDPSFILYTSGTTGTPKGLLHTTGGYLTHICATFNEMFEPKNSDIYWCAADIGWITGHSYLVYAPLALGLTTLLFEGIPTYPEPDRFWKTIDKFGVNIFYTSPTAIRSLQKFGDKIPNKFNLQSLRVLGSVGEPINEDAWKWFFNIIGKGKCPIIDTWWQTETGGVVISPKYREEIQKMNDGIALKPGCVTRPLSGMEVDVLDDDGKSISKETGFLAIKKPCPGMARTVYGDHKLFIKAYWEKIKGVYFTGDSAKKDADGDFWITGRIDDEINVSGHRIGSIEVEGAISSCKDIVEAAIVPIKHEIKGSALYAFVVITDDAKEEDYDELRKKIKNIVSKKISPVAKPSYIQFVSDLPKTRSGKIVRRILKAIANKDDDIGNLITISNPEIIEEIKKNVIAG